jgi:hypothetical protein
VRQPVDADPLVGRPAFAVTGQSQPRQLPSVHHFVHALGFLALRVKTARALECLTGIGLNTRLALHVRWRGGFALRFFTDQAGSGWRAGWSAVVGAGVPVVGPVPASVAASFFVTSTISWLQGPARALPIPKTKAVLVRTKAIVEARMNASFGVCGNTLSSLCLRTVRNATCSDPGSAVFPRAAQYVVVCEFAALPAARVALARAATVTHWPHCAAGSPQRELRRGTHFVGRTLCG